LFTNIFFPPFACTHFAEPCVSFLARLAEELDLVLRVEYPVTQEKPIVILTLVGTQPELKSIILNSHMDVVPVFEEYWTHKPFDADMDADGKIFARGAQDMKSVGTQYLGALRYFRRKQISFKRSIHVMFVPEEELGGDGGMADFVHTEAFRNLNAGFSLDEGKAPVTAGQFVTLNRRLSLQGLHRPLMCSTCTTPSVVSGT
jgi:aminoacylase